MEKQRDAEEDRLDEATCRGRARLCASEEVGAAVIRASYPFSGAEPGLMARQSAVMGSELPAYYMELFTRAHALIEFWDNNVGGSAEFPITVSGETPAAARMLASHVSELRVVVGFMSEV